MNPILAVLLLAATILPSVAGQTRTRVSPLAYTSLEGVGGHALPFYQGTPCTHMQVHDDLQGTQMRILQIALRRDGPGSQTYAAFSANLSLRLSETTVFSSVVSPTFAANHGPGIVQVLNKVTLNFPAAPPPAQPPAPFSYVIPFANTPFLYSGINFLCWELWVHSTTQPASPIYYFDSSYFNRGQFGQGCAAPGQTNPPDLSSCIVQQTRPSMWKLWIAADHAPANTSLLWLIGDSNTSWGAVPLPHDLSPYGAAGCNLHIAPAVILASTTSSNGTFNNWNNGSIVFPLNPIFGGSRIFHQIACVAPGRPGLPLVFSNGSWCMVPPQPLPFARIYSYTGTGATTGNVFGSYGAITEFRYL